MMVASTSLMKLQESPNHRYMDIEPSVPNMTFRPAVRRHNSEGIDSPSFRNGQNNLGPEFEGRNNRPSPPEYSETNGEGDGASRGLMRIRERSFSERKTSDSGSPLDENPERANVIQSTNIQYISVGQRSPSGLSPPMKRMAEKNSYHKVQESISNWAISSASNTSALDNQIKDLRYSNGRSSMHESRDSRQAEYSFGKHSHHKYSMSIGEDQYSDGVHVRVLGSVEDDDTRSRSPLNGMHPMQKTSNHASTTKSMNGTSNRSIPSTPHKTSSKSSSQRNAFEDDDDDSWKICSVCGDKATGYHFNALTCEGCKGFFRRSMKNGKNFTCPYTGNCQITKSNRRQCQACRLQKCLRIGMKKECIMSRTEIQMKKNLMLNNKIKRCVMEWKPLEYSAERRQLVTLISESHTQTNGPPDIREEDGMLTIRSRDPGASPASTSSGFSDLINQMTQDIVATAPGPSNPSKSHLRHFSAIMEFSIKEIIKFCKKIPSFTSLSLKDQITLLKSGCTEILFIKANYTYDREQNALMCGPGKYYTRDSFILGGMSEEYTDCYLQFHHDLSHMLLDESELACMCATSLFSGDRDGLENRSLVEEVQERITVALQSYTETIYHSRVRFPKIMAYLTRLRTLNWHISKTLDRIQSTSEANDIKPLVFECMPNV